MYYKVLPKGKSSFGGTDWGLHFCKETHKICKNALFLEFLAYLHFVATMTKAEIVSEIAAKTGLEKQVVLTVVEAMMDTIKTSMINGNEVFLRGFGSFIIKHRAEKTARNISKNTTIIIPAHNIPAFKPAKEFMEKVK